MTATEPSIENNSENFREKILRKCGGNVEMKEKFFGKNAGPIEAMSREMAGRFASKKNCSSWATAAINPAAAESIFSSTAASFEPATPSV